MSQIDYNRRNPARPLRWSAFSRSAGNALCALAFSLAATLAAEAGVAEADADVREPEATLYSRADAIPGARIGWIFDDAERAYQEALDRQLPLVLVFGADWCEWCWTYLDQALTCPSFNRFSGLAIFAYLSPDEDELAQTLLERLEIDGYPTLSVLAPDATQLMELFRASGFFTGDALSALLAEALVDAGYDVPDQGHAQDVDVQLSRTPTNPGTCRADRP